MKLFLHICLTFVKAERRRQKEELRKEREAIKLKAATEKAAARKIAKESMELIEDERLELLELAASSKGLTSIVSLDYETMQNLDSFRGYYHFWPLFCLIIKGCFTYLTITSYIFLRSLMCVSTEDCASAIKTTFFDSSMDRLRRKHWEPFHGRFLCISCVPSKCIY